MLTDKQTNQQNIFSQYLTPNCIRSLVEVNNQKHVLEIVAKLLHQELTEFSSQAIMKQLVTREKLGSCWLGCNVALPHSRIENITRPYIAFITLKTPIKYDEINNAPINIVCATLIPQHSVEQHLDVVAKLTQFLRDESFREKISTIDGDQLLFDTLTHWPKP